MEPLREDIAARLAQTTAAHLRPRKADMPAAAVITTIVDLKAGTRASSVIRFPSKPAVKVVPAPEPLPPREEHMICKWCNEPVSLPRRRFCSEECARKHHGYHRAPIDRWEPVSAPVPIEVANAYVSPLDKVKIIQQVTCAVWGVPIESMASDRRGRVWAWPRMCAMTLCYRFVAGLSLPAVGRRFGNRDHTTIKHALDATTKRLKSRRRDYMTYAKYYREAEARCIAALGNPVDA